MAVSLNSVVGFNSTANYQQITSINIRTALPRFPQFTSMSGAIGLRRSIERKRSQFYLLVANGDFVATETNNEGSKNFEGSYSDEGSSSDEKSSGIDDKVQASGDIELALRDSEASNGSIDSIKLNTGASAVNSSSTQKRAPLTARERLRAARVLSRYTDSKPSKPELGSKLLEALRESDKGKRRPGLPEAPSNMLDDSKRGLPKPGWTFEFPGGVDVFLVILSFVLISTVMFSTTYIVWKVGAIHFNEY
ncbi:uncharacterized protein LOC111382125 [Olea europaea subsp. europaea]|uniref:Uncharacterized protein LOC111382125, partial n=1 Tax=Olea europaea subsp. europaea TaxID=158383 RepID=A0A8S0R4B9_OLEEU|nr:uncharacterized protein LOC111382125 [Olea europaea subsp. europaea]